MRSPKVWISVGVILGALIISDVINRALRRYMARTTSEGKRVINTRAMFTLLRSAIFLCAILIVFEVNSISMSSLVTSLGLVTAAVAFAVQDVLKDYIMGYNLIHNEFFTVGDVVQYRDVYGVVRSFNMRSTKIYNLNNGNLFSVCNRDITEIEKVSDWLDIEIPTGYGENVEKVRAVCREICRKCGELPNVKSCDFLGTDGFLDSAVTYRIRIHCPPTRKGVTRRASLGIIQDIFAKRGISIPYPQMDVHFETPEQPDNWQELRQESKTEGMNEMSQLERKRFGRGEVIFWQGEWAAEMYDILEGKVGIYLDYGKPGQKQLTVLEKGRYFGEMGLVDAMPRSATAVAEEDTAVQVVTGKDLGEWFKDKPDKIIEIMKFLSQRTRELTADYMEVCRTVAELQDAEDAGTEKSTGLLERIRNFASVWKKNERDKVPAAVMVQPSHTRGEEWIRLARRDGLGFEALELSTPPALCGGEPLDRALSWYRENGLVQSVHGAFMDINVTSSDPELRKISLTRCRSSCAMARELGAGWVVFHSSAYPYLDSGVYLEKWAAQCLDAYLPMAEEYRLAICVENCLDQSPKALRALMERADSPLLRVCLDLGHVNYTPTPVEAWFDALGPYISYLHLSDNNGRMDDHLPLGCGNVDWEKADRLWRRLEQSAALTMEVGGIDGVKTSLRYLRENGYFGFGGAEGG